MVRLTVRQVGRVGELVQQHQCERVAAAFEEWWGREKYVASKHRVDVLLPASGWSVVEQAMFTHCFDERGFRSRQVRSTDLNALKSIRRALNAREHHPALSRRGAIGMIGELIPAWKLDEPDDGLVYSPHPVAGAPFVVLAPESTVVRTKQTTMWVESHRCNSLPLLNEDEHWRFVA